MADAAGSHCTARFGRFIAATLASVGIAEARVAQYTRPEALAKFSLALTHQSFDPRENYERYEFVGDSIVNNAVADYLANTKFPKLRSVLWLTRLKHTLMSKKQLARLAYGRGFLEHIRCGAGEAAIVAAARANRTRGGGDPLYGAPVELLSLLEDSFEAFAAALQDVVDGAAPRGAPRVGNLVAQQMVQKLLAELDIELDFDKLFDPKTRYKQLCDKFGWQFRSCRANARGSHEAIMVHGPCPAGTYVEVYGYPLGDRRRHPANRARLAAVELRDRDEAHQAAARRALRVLEAEYGICEEKLEPYSE